MERNWIRNSSDDYRISSNKTRWRLFISVFGTKGAIIGGKAIIRGRGLFQILLTRSRALILCSIFPVKKNSNQNKLNIGIINFQCQWPQRQNLNRH